ncbi:MAG: addiction module toxin, HicA family [Patescibacteria group bacterium]
MKRSKLIVYLNHCGCVFLREGTRHTLFVNPLLDKVSSMPRHREVDNLLAEKICKDLGIKSIRKK